MDVSFLRSVSTGDVGAVIVVVTTKDGASSAVDRVKSLVDPGCVDAAFAAMTDFKYGSAEGLTIISAGVKRELLIVSAGDKALFSRASFEKLGGRIFDGISAKEAKVTILNTVESAEFPEAAAYIASGISLKSWAFDKYKTIKADQKVGSIVCETAYVDENTKALARLDAVRDGVFTVRSMVTEPANVMTPDQIVEEAKKLKSLGVEITVLDRRNMESFGMHALLGVGQGSTQASYTVIMEYKGSKDAPIALIGKGLTFDSGGICVKPANRMGEMKEDMTGAAVVIGTIEAIASQKLKAHVVGCIGVVENMISGNAQRPGDVVTSMSGKTIEVDNTDAEGRLVLADVLWYACEEYKPKIMIDVATLTGAIQVALGHEFAGLFTNSDELAEAITRAADTVGEKVWRFPLHQSYEDDIKSDIADVKNVGSGRGAGSITAAMFLKKFICDDVQWAHIDIAAVSSDSKGRALSQKGVTGFGVRLLEEVVRSRCVN